jgi:hypothetical protein
MLNLTSDGLMKMIDKSSDAIAATTGMAIGMSLGRAYRESAVLNLAFIGGGTLTGIFGPGRLIPAAGIGIASGAMYEYFFGEKLVVRDGAVLERAR